MINQPVFNTSAYYKMEYASLQKSLQKAKKNELGSPQALQILALEAIRMDAI